MGIEWNMYDRVNLSLEYYNKKTTDLLFEVPTSLITGFDSRWENLGALKNDGFELELNSKNISNKNFTWTSNFNLTYQRALVDKLPEGKISSMETEKCICTVRESQCIHSICPNGKV